MAALRDTRGEESPGSTEARCRVTPAGATPGKVPQKVHRQPAAARPAGGKGETVRQERTAPPVTAAAGKTPPGARPSRSGRHPGVIRRCRASLRAAARVGRTRRSETSVPEEWPSPPRAWRQGAGQNPAYTPSGFVVVVDLLADQIGISALYGGQRCG